jgi:hypothetical protein
VDATAGVRNAGQIAKFRGGHKLVWTVTASDGTVVASRTAPNPEYGDLTGWGPEGALDDD